MLGYDEIANYLTSVTSRSYVTDIISGYGKLAMFIFHVNMYLIFIKNTGNQL